MKSLRFFLAGEGGHAADLYLVLMRYVKRIVIAPLQDGQSLTLDAAQLKAVGFEESQALFPGSATGLASHQLMHEYFIQPDKFMFVDLMGWEQWGGRGEGAEFEIRFELDKIPFALHQVDRGDFVLFATPAVNVFEHRAEPIILETTETNYSVIPAGGNPSHYQTYSVHDVAGLFDKTAQKIEIASGKRNQHSSMAPTYQISRKSSHIHQGLDVFISVKAPPKTNIQQMTLNVGLLCSNGKIPDKIQEGDICKETDNSPNFAEFTSCKPVRRSEYINMGNNTLWRLYSSFNHNIALLNAMSMRSMLKAVSQTYNSDYATSKLYATQIQGIMDFQTKSSDRLFGRSMLRGWEIRIKLNQEAFSSFGSMFLFGVVLDDFLRGFATESCFTQTIIEDVKDKTRYVWPAKVGRRSLL
ncbi:MAG: type VI secretion system baseplate subunit TssF [Geobacter sp.]|nr:type VI secretion system baseplate subunit TssF [Geobacter sp.]